VPSVVCCRSPTGCLRRHHRQPPHDCSHRALQRSQAPLPLLSWSRAACDHQCHAGVRIDNSTRHPRPAHLFFRAASGVLLAYQHCTTAWDQRKGHDRATRDACGALHAWPTGSGGPGHRQQKYAARAAARRTS
jgi:hypothetical protein